MASAEDRRREMEELAGGTTPIKRGRGRPRKNPIDAPKPQKKEVVDPLKEDDIDMSFRTAHVAAKGLPIRWFAHAFQMSEHNVKGRLRNVTPVDFGSHGNPLYAMLDAAPRLVDPEVDVGDFLKSLKDEDLPDDLRLKLWQARKARNRVLEEEGELWHSSMVIAKFSEVLLAMREKLQLIPDKIERVNGITAEQYKLIRGVIDGVQNDIHQTILEMAAKDETYSILGGEEEGISL